MNELTFACVLIVDDIILWIAKDVSESRGCSVLTTVHRVHLFLNPGLRQDLCDE